MEKRIPSSWDFGQPRISLLGGEGRLDRHRAGNLVKSAGGYIFDSFLRNWQPAPGEVPLHVIVIGSTEYHGPNRNGDGFRVATCRKYHPTFVKNARMYRNHQYHDPRRSYGVVKASAYNDVMHRIELIVALNGTKEAADRNGGLVADRELEILSRGEEIPVSMSCVCLPRTPVLTLEFGYVPISMVRPGMHVLTHTGSWRRVTKITRRKWRGRPIAIRGPIMGDTPLILTPEHMVYTAGPDMEDAIAGKFLWFHISCLDMSRPNWFAAVRVRNWPFEVPSSEPGFWYAVTYAYINSSHTRIINGEDLEIAVPEGTAGDLILSRLHETIPPSRLALTGYSSRKSIQFWKITDPGFAADFFRTCRIIERWDGGKYISYPYAPFTRQDWKEAAIAAALDSFFHHNFSERATAGSSSLTVRSYYNVPMLHIRDLLVAGGLTVNLKDRSKRIQLPASLRQLAPRSVSSTTGLPTLDDAEWGESRKYQVRIAFDEEGNPAVRLRVMSARMDHDDYVYNLEVAGDHSYCTDGIFIHNCHVPFDVCSGCGNRATTRLEYCDESSCPRGGLKRNMGKLFKDGHVLHADNPNPNFFDVSHVYRPADRIAYVVGVACPGGSCSLADVSRFVKVSSDRQPADLLGTARIDRAILHEIVKKGWSVDHTCPIERDVFIEDWAEDPHRIRPGAFLHGLAKLGVVLPPEQFAQVLCGRYAWQAEPGIRKSASALRLRIEEETAQLYQLGIDRVTSRCIFLEPNREELSVIRKAAADLVPAFSVSPEKVMERITFMPVSLTKRGDDSFRISSEPSRRFVEQYLAYQTMALRTIRSRGGKVFGLDLGPVS